MEAAPLPVASHPQPPTPTGPGRPISTIQSLHSRPSSPRREQSTGPSKTPRSPLHRSRLSNLDYNNPKRRHRQSRSSRSRRRHQSSRSRIRSPPRTRRYTPVSLKSNPNYRLNRVTPNKNKLNDLACQVEPTTSTDVTQCQCESFHDATIYFGPPHSAAV